MPVEYDYLNQRLEQMREHVKHEIAMEFSRRDTARYQHQSKIMLWATTLFGVVLWTVLLTLKFAT